MLYGGIKPAKVLGRDEFARHDATKTWDDGGIAVELANDLLRASEEAITEAVNALRQQQQDLAASIATDMANYGAYQVRDAVVDYLGSSEFFLTLHEGELYIVVDGSNDQATFQPLVKLDHLLMRAKVQAQQQADTAFLARMADLVTALPQIARHLSETGETMPIHQKRASVTAPRPAGRRVAAGGANRGAAAR